MREIIQALELKYAVEDFYPRSLPTATLCRLIARRIPPSEAYSNPL
jgi:hypothetical protein